MGLYQELGDRLEEWIKNEVKVVDSKIEFLLDSNTCTDEELQTAIAEMVSEINKEEIANDTE